MEAVHVGNNGGKTITHSGTNIMAYLTASAGGTKVLLGVLGLEIVSAVVAVVMIGGNSNDVAI